MARSGRSRYTSMADVQAALKDTRKKYKANMPDVINKLAAIGYEAITLAWSEVRYGKINPHTYNLYDSYASAVYLKGKLMPNSVRFVQGERSKEPDRFGMTGRDYAFAYLQNPPISVLDKSKDISILCIAAVPYTKYLEEGTYNLADRFLGSDGKWYSKDTRKQNRPLGAKIRIISAAADYLERHKAEINKICQGLFRGTVFESPHAVNTKNFKITGA